MDVRFVASESAFTMLATLQLIQGRPLGDPMLAAALADPADDLKLLLDSKNVAWPVVERHLVPLAASIGNNYELAEVLLRKVGAAADDRHYRTVLVRALTEVENATLRARPELAAELKHAATQLQAAWQSHGQELLTKIAFLTEDRMIAEQATVVACTDALGEIWQAYPAYNTVTATHPQGPADAHERTARLAWLLSQLQIDLPAYSDGLIRTGPAVVASLAMIPVTLAAMASDHAPFREGVPPVLGGACDEPAIRKTLEEWRPEFDASAFSGPLWDWWDTYATGGGSWPVALAALDRLLDR